MQVPSLATQEWHMKLLACGFGGYSGVCCPKVTPHTSRRLYSRSLPIRSLLSPASQASLAAYLPRSDAFSLRCWKQSGLECHSTMKSWTPSHNTAVVMTGAIVTLCKKRMSHRGRKHFLAWRTNRSEYWFKLIYCPCSEMTSKYIWNGIKRMVYANLVIQAMSFWTGRWRLLWCCYI